MVLVVVTFYLLAGIGSLVGPFAIAPIIFFGSFSTLFLGINCKDLI